MAFQNRSPCHVPLGDLSAVVLSRSKPLNYVLPQCAVRMQELQLWSNHWRAVTLLCIAISKLHKTRPNRANRVLTLLQPRITSSTVPCISEADLFVAPCTIPILHMFARLSGCGTSRLARGHRNIAVAPSSLNLQVAKTILQPICRSVPRRSYYGHISDSKMAPNLEPYFKQ